LLSITRDSDSTSLAIGQTAGPQSLLDTSAIATFCAGTTGRVTTYHGAFGHDLVSVGSQAPAIYASGALKATANGTPAMFFDGTGANIMQYASSSASYPNGTMYLFAKGVQLADYLASYTLVSGDTAGCLEVRVDVTTGLVRLLAQGGTTIGVTPYSIPLNVPVNISAFYNSDGSYSIWLNGVKVVQGTGTLVTVAAANIRVGAGPSGANPLKGLIVGGMINFNASAYAWNNPQYMIERYQNNFLGPMGAIVVPTTTFDPAHISSNIVLSNGNLTARYNSSGSNVNAFGTISKSAGLFYHELRINTKGAGHEFIGYANNSFSTAISQALGNDVAKNSVGWWSTGEVKIGGSTLTTIATYATGSVLGLCLDLTHSKVWFGVISGSTVLWNNDVLANQNPATNTGGISISTITAGALFPCVTLQTFNDQITTNFGATAYTNATLLPSGFGNWQ
jgi:hypothetical protein